MKYLRESNLHIGFTKHKYFVKKLLAEIYVLSNLVRKFNYINFESNWHMQTPDSLAGGWFTDRSWKHGWTPEPDPSINISSFYKKVQEHPLRWEAAFRFLSNAGIEDLEPGVYPVLGNEVYAMVSEYTTRPLAEARFEAHRKYADVQYLINGTELIGLGNTQDARVSEPYSEEKDVEFFHAMGGKLLHADSKVFFIFFPEDAHQPCIAPKDPSKVKKVVVKVSLL
jgi:YhcH/YjgK/YiaL family protein